MINILARLTHRSEVNKNFIYKIDMLTRVNIFDERLRCVAPEALVNNVKQQQT